MAYQKNSGGKKVLWIVIAIAAVIAILLAVFIPRMQARRSAPRLSMTSYSGQTQENASEETVTTTASTVDANNRDVKVSGDRALSSAQKKYPDYDFNLEGMKRGKDGTLYYSLEGVDSHGNVEEVQVNALTGEVVS